MNGKPNGKGVFKWKNGNEYTGDFSDGKQHGVGNLHISASGKTFVTKWVKGDMVD